MNFVRKPQIFQMLYLQVHTFHPLRKSQLLTRVVDARFEVLGGPNSLLSVSLSASQNLFTRRGTLVGVGGKAENVRFQGS